MNKRETRVRKPLLCRDCQAPVELFRLDCYCLPCREKRSAAAAGAISERDLFHEAVELAEYPKDDEVAG